MCESYLISTVRPKTMAPPGWINWKNSPAREIIMDDLQEESLGLEENETSAKEAWDTCYMHIT
jgi:hypothetical protein